MKKLLGLCLIASAVLLTAPFAVAADEEKNWNFIGGVRVRADYFENYDFSDATDDSAAIWPFTIRFGVEGELAENVHGLIELRNDSLFGGSPTFNEDPSVLPPPGLFFFTVPNVLNLQDDVRIYQAAIKLSDLGITGFEATIGRQEYTYGTELLIGDNDFYTGQSYDGVRLTWGHERIALNGFYYKLVETNFGLTGTGSSSDTNFFGLTFDWKFEGFGDLGVYYLDYQALDETGTVTSFPGSTATYGARWGRLKAADDQWFDWNIEYAIQSGDLVTGTDLDGDVLEGWFGFNIHGDTMHHRFALGYLNASGDDPTTTDNEAFFPLFNDNHAWNRLGNLDAIAVSDIEDINLSYNLIVGKHTMGVAFHQLATDEGVIGTGGATFDEIGTAWDLWYDYQMNENYGFQVGVSSLMNGDLIDDPIAGVGTPNEDPMRAWGQFSLRW